MLIAAMILGLIGGITYFVGGGAGTIAWTGDGAAPWWVVSLIPIGALGAMGAALARTKPNVAGIVMLLAAASAMGIGFASFGDYAARQVTAGELPSGYLSVLVPTHAFAGTILYVPFPLLTLIIGGVLALSSGKKSGAED
jgi:hypothetical protein